MNKEEKVRYLANLYFLLLADGQVERAEEKEFEKIARDLSAGYFERKEAMEIAKNEGLQLHLPSRLSQRIRNLEDMLFLAYANDALDPAEKEPIMDYANHLGISQQQLNVIKQETKQRYVQYKEGQR